MEEETLGNSSLLVGLSTEHMHQDKLGKVQE